MKNNNLIPSLLIACGLFYVGANLNKEQETKVIQAEPVVAKTVASSTGVVEPVIVWYDVVNASADYFYGNQDKIFDSSVLVRAWSDGVIEAKAFELTFRRVYGVDNQDCYTIADDISCDDFSSTEWIVISSPQMACRTDVNGDGEIEYDDLLAVLSQWGDTATCPDTVQLQCGLLEMN